MGGKESDKGGKEGRKEIPMEKQIENREPKRAERRKGRVKERRKTRVEGRKARME